MGSLSLGSVTESLGDIGGNGSSMNGITDTIADAIGDLVANAVRTMLGNLS